MKIDREGGINKMYIPQFVVGFITCILVEFVVLCIYCIYDSWKKKRK